MQKIGLTQSIIHKLSPYQIQFMKLLQVPAVAMESYIEKEVADNPLLTTEEEQPEEKVTDTITLSEGAGKDSDISYYDTSYLQNSATKISRETWLPTTLSLHEQLLEQLNFLTLTKKQKTIAVHLVGSINDDGYIDVAIETIVSDLATMYYLATNVDEVITVLHAIQQLDPPGIGARNLQECLLIQLTKGAGQEHVTKLAQAIITYCFDAFQKKHYDKIVKKLAITHIGLLKQAIACIKKLNPKPVSQPRPSLYNDVLSPDFLVTTHNDTFIVDLRYYHTSSLQISKKYLKLLDDYQHHPDKSAHMEKTIAFIKSKMEGAQWFMNAIQQRNQTLLNTMNAIVQLQYPFFQEEEEKNLKPMILKDVAAAIQMDISTISRIVSNKAVQTKLGIYPLKFFFSKGIHTNSGDEISNKVVKKIVVELIKKEDKHKPHSDDTISELLQQKGYHIARRTVAKYREQLHIPVARLRREI